MPESEIFYKLIQHAVTALALWRATCFAFHLWAKWFDSLQRPSTKDM